MQVGDIVGGRFRVVAPIPAAHGRPAFSGEGPEGPVCIKVWTGAAEARAARFGAISRELTHAGTARLKHLEHRAGGVVVVEDLIVEPAAAIPASPAHVLGFLTSLLGILTTCHEAGVVHGRLTPWRIGRASDGRYLVRGFDGAFSRSAPIADTTRSAWTAAWAAPEQGAQGLIDERIDLYAAALLASFFLTGKPPRPASRAAFDEVAASEPSLPPEAMVGEGWYGVLVRSLSRAPAERFSSAKAMLRAVKMLAKIAAIAAPTREAVTGTALEKSDGTVIVSPFDAPMKAGEAALPFGAPVKTAFAPLIPAVAQAPAKPDAAPPVPAANATVFGSFRLDDAPSLPFREGPAQPPLPPAATPVATAPAATGTVFGARAADVITPFFARADAHVAKISEDAEHRLPLDRYATVRAELWQAPERVDEVLQRHGLDRIGWHCYEGRELRSADRPAEIAKLFDAVRARRRKPR
ncbi:MAG: hypothetical protein HOV80_33385 [Polyangiaceae bacterium]|nr:hypothetical protein [Polyangiaceae bacterium]